VRYTHGHHDSVLRSHRWRTVENSAAYLTPWLTPEARVLDVGCGPGTITADLAGRVREVVAIDNASAAVEICQAEVAGIANVTVREADVYSLPFEDGSFDVVHAHQVLQHLGDPAAALAEMRRVCRAGGVVGARDGDYPAMAWYPYDPMLDRWMELYLQVARSNGGEPAAGRHMLAWARTAGFTDIEPSATAWCHATPDDRAHWGGMWAERVVASAFADQAVADGFATTRELQLISDAWMQWADDANGWFMSPHGEIVCHA